MEKRTYQDIAVPFGKHKGVLLADIPNGYLNWLSEQEFVEEKFPDLFAMIQMEIDYRNRFDIVIEE